MDILDILLDILLKPPQPLMGLFFLSAVVKVQVTSVFEKLFPIIENNVKVFYTYGWVS